MDYVTIADINKLNVDKIFLDFDCTIVDSIKVVLNQLNERYNTSYKTRDCKTWNFKNLYPDLSEIELLEIFDSERFFKEVRLYNGAKKFINDNLNKITIVSCGLATNLVKKKIWLNKRFKGINFIGLDSVDTDKSSVKMGENTLHIDDNERNLLSTDAQYKILFQNVKNADWNSTWTLGSCEGRMMNKWE